MLYYIEWQHECHTEPYRSVDTEFQHNTGNTMSTMEKATADTAPMMKAVAKLIWHFGMNCDAKKTTAKRIEYLNNFRIVFLYFL